MGIAARAYRLLLDERKKGVLNGGKILQLGRQCILFDHQTLCKYAKLHKVPLVEFVSQLSFDDYYKKLNYIDDITLFKSLGFESVHSLDYSGFEGADIVWDLNEPIPEKYWNQFDVIYDGGTSEHVFNFPQVLRNIHLMLKEGGVIIHDSPSNHHVDHGFYMYSPQVYSEYYFANHYTLLTSYLIEYSRNFKKPWDIYAYQPGMLESISWGNFGNKMLLIHLVAQKTSVSTSSAIPQQGSYMRAWKAKTAESAKPKRKVDPITRLGISLNKKIKRRMPFFLKRYLEKKKLHKVASY